MYVAAAGSYLNRKGNGSESHGEHRFLMPVRCDWGFTNHRLSDSLEVGLRRADRWSALAYATTNGIGSRIFCQVAKATSKGLRSEEHTSELQSRQYLVCRLLLEKKKT